MINLILLDVYVVDDPSVTARFGGINDSIYAVSCLMPGQVLESGCMVDPRDVLSLSSTSSTG